MNSSDQYLQTNRSFWNNIVDAHLRSDFYDLDGFLKGRTSLNEIELTLLGDLKGRSVLHLQCHFGQDSISLSRMGADVVGVDLSDKAIEAAKALAKQTGSRTSFLCSDVYDLPHNLEKDFDLVFTSYGTIAWLPDLQKWAELISRYLKPGGRLVFVEFHPVVWMFDDNFDSIRYSYFNRGPITETETGSYADRSAGIKQESVTWNHSIGEVISSLISNGLGIEGFEEHDYSPYNCFKRSIETAPHRFQLEPLKNKIPMVYSITARKPAC